jgi:DNA-binding MarR family transcriptional regulator
MPEEWVTMKEAAKELGVSPSKISRLAAINVIAVKIDPVDRRIKLVDLNQVRQVLNRQYR